MRIERRDFIKLGAVGLLGLVAANKFPFLIEKKNLESEETFIEWEEVPGIFSDKWRRADKLFQLWKREQVEEEEGLDRQKSIYSMFLAVKPEVSESEITLITYRPRKRKFTFKGGDLYGRDDANRKLFVSADREIIESALSKFSKIGRVEFLYRMTAIVPKGTPYWEIYKDGFVSLAPLPSYGLAPYKDPPKQIPVTLKAIDWPQRHYTIRVTRPNGAQNFYRSTIFKVPRSQVG